jgi:hypothetical protein
MQGITVKIAVKQPIKTVLRQNVIQVSVGKTGSAGREVELESDGTNVRWRYAGEPVWYDLVAIAELQGETGPAGPTGAQGATGSQGPTGNTGATGPQGIQGVKGDTGNTGATGATGAAGTNGTNGTNGADGDDGREVELQKSATHIQWRYVGDVSWTNLVLLTDIKGDTGATGAQGATGNTGAQGIQGIQGIQGATGAAGADGTDGADGVVDYARVIALATVL